MRAFATSVLLLLLALTLGWRIFAPAEAPPATDVPSAGSPGADPAAAADAVAASGGAAGSVRATAVPAAAAAGGTARLTVAVRAGADGPPLADRDVAVIVVAAADGVPLAVARTAADGCCQFALPLGERTALRVQSGPGTAQTLDLAPGATVALTLQVAVRAWAEGRVVDARGQGIAAADLLLEPWAAPLQRTTCWRLGKSDAAGRFRVPLQLGGLLGAVHSDHAPSARVVVLPGEAGAPPPVRTFELALLAAPARAVVAVKDRQRRPVPGAVVWAVAEAAGNPGAAPTSATTGADGTAVLAPLPPGRLRFTVRAAGHGEATARGEAAAGATLQTVVELPAAAAVHGRVTDATGAPVAGAWVVAAAPGGVDPLRAASDADGAYQLAGLAPGTVRLSAWRPGAANPAAQTELTLAADAPAVWHPVLAPPTSGPQLTGSLADAAGRPLANWRLVARLGNGERRQTTSDAGGQFAIGLDDGAALDLLAYAPGSSGRRFAALHQRIAAPLAGPVELRLPPPGSHGSLSARVVDASGAPLAAAWQCWHHERREFAQGQADGQGRLHLAEVPAGTVDLQLSLPGHAALQRDGLRLAAGERLDLGDLALAAGGGLHGSVVGPDGSAPAELTLTLLQGREARPVAYAGGSYRIADVPTGEHLLQVQGPTVAGAVFRVTVTAGVDREHEIRLLAGVRRPLWVRAPAAAGRSVTLAVRRGDEPPQWLQSAALVDGVARFEACLLPGTYRVQAWTAAGYRAAGEVEFRAGLDAPHELALQPR